MNSKVLYLAIPLVEVERVAVLDDGAADDVGVGLEGGARRGPALGHLDPHVQAQLVHVLEVALQDVKVVALDLDVDRRVGRGSLPCGL